MLDPRQQGTDLRLDEVGIVLMGIVAGVRQNVTRVGVSVVANLSWASNHSACDGRSVTMELKGGLIRRASVTHAVQEVGADSCQVTYSIEGQMRPLLAWATPLIPAIGRRLVRSNLANLARLAESAPVA